MVNVNRAFSKLVFLQIMMGTLAFCLASRDIGMLMIVGVLGTVAWFVVERRGGKPMPQWIVGSGAIVASAWLVLAIFEQQQEPVRAMGTFILWLQLLLLFGKKSNREYAELLVLSLMLMVGATTINQAVIFGLLLVVYYTLALFTLLTFQFKILSDRITRLRAAAQVDAAAGPVHEVTMTSGFRWQFRVMAVGMGLVASCVGVVVFLSLPRGGSAGGNNSRLAALQQHREVDFTPQINLDEPPPESASREPVMNVTITLDGEKFGGSDKPQLIRGAALDRYDVVRRTWSVDPRSRSSTVRFAVPRAGTQLVQVPPSTRMLDVRFTLRGRSPRSLFSLFPPVAFESNNLNSVQFNLLDQTLSAVDRPESAIEYVVSTPLIVSSSYFSQMESPDILDPRTDLPIDEWWRHYVPVATAVNDIADWVWPEQDDPLDGYYPSAEQARESLLEQLSQVDRPNSFSQFWGLQIDALVRGAEASYTRSRPPILRGLRAEMEFQEEQEYQLDVAAIINQDRGQWAGYARGWPVDEIAVRNLAEAVLVEAGVDQTSDTQIARALTNYMRENYTYSLTNTHETSGRDPTVAFLFDHRQGHCELFASGLAALARARGMRARVATGYLATEYIATGGYYIVRKSDAHAWTEIYCEGVGWRTFDPTPPADVLAERAPGTVLSWLTDLYDHVEFTWIGSIVTYDSRTRSGVLDSVNQAINSTLLGDKSWFAENMESFDEAVKEATAGNWTALLTLAGVVIGLLLLLYVVFLVVRRLLMGFGRRLSTRRQSEPLPSEVGFYPRMLTMLAAVGHVREDWQTPLAFAEQLVVKDRTRFAAVERLTRQFYELYYGARPMDAERRAAIEQDMSQLRNYLREQLPEARGRQARQP
jgi:hypothetical protein